VFFGSTPLEEVKQTQPTHLSHIPYCNKGPLQQMPISQVLLTATNKQTNKQQQKFSSLMILQGKLQQQSNWIYI
jgi:hypothetical protein